MSIKTTKHIDREEALGLLALELVNMSNTGIADLLDYIADSDRGKFVTRFDNFIVNNEYKER
jgi:hypothetical protein